MLTTAYLAGVMDSAEDPWDSQRVRRHLVKLGVARKHGRQWVTSWEQLTAYWPELYNRLMTAQREREELG